MAEARGLDVNKDKSYADAHIFSSKRAKDLGLIDEIGVMNTTKADLVKLAKVKKPEWKEKDKLESFMEQFAAKSILHVQSFFYGLKATL